MSDKTAVINASPFIIYSKSGLIELIPQLFQKVIMPRGVALEIGEGKDFASDVPDKISTQWLNIETTVLDEEINAWNLGSGETEVLSIAKKHAKISIALVDDRAARRCAEVLQIRTLGTSGILLLAKKEGLVNAVAPEIDKLKANGLYISEALREIVLRSANEYPIT